MTCSKEVHQAAVASKTALQWPMTPESQEVAKQKHDPSPASNFGTLRPSAALHMLTAMAPYHNATAYRCRRNRACDLVSLVTVSSIFHCL
jgi:hypothetical protein